MCVMTLSRWRHGFESRWDYVSFAVGRSRVAMDLRSGEKGPGRDSISMHRGSLAQPDRSFSSVSCAASSQMRLGPFAAASARGP